MNQETSDGPAQRNKPLIGKRLLSWSMKTKKCVSRIFLKTIPTYLTRKVENISLKVCHLKTYQSIFPERSEHVYDIINVGPNHRFTVMGDYPILVSNCVQSTGHDVLMLYIKILRETLDERGLPYEWLISDFHDQFLLETDVDAAKDIWQTVNDAEDLLNKELDGDIRIQFDPQWIENFAQAKVEGYRPSDEFSNLLHKYGLSS